MLIFSTKEPVLQCVEEIYRQQADILCFSAYIWNRQYLLAMLKILQQLLPEASFVVGGPEAAAFQAISRCQVILGAGEAAFYAYAASGFTQLDLEIAPLPLAQLPFPYQPEDIAELEDHLLYYECYRGCPYQCAYCLSSQDFRSESRFAVQKPEELLRLQAELDALMALSPRTVKFIDRSFNINKALAHYIWRYAMQDTHAADFHFEIYPDLLDAPDLQLLESAPLGKIRFEIGIQTINSEVLAACGRHSDWPRSQKVLQALKTSGRIRVHTDLIAGLPTENFASVMASLDALCACEPAAVQLGMLKILPDTPMQEIARSRGYQWLEDPPYQVLSTDALSYSELCRLDDCAHLLSLYWNKEEFAPEWHQLLQKAPASQILAELKALHAQHDLPLHSVARGKRQSIMAQLLQAHHLY